MNRRPFCGATVLGVGLGCWQLGGDWGRVDDEAARAIPAAAYDGGCRLFDTAEDYSVGRSERRIGRVQCHRHLDHALHAAKRRVLLSS